MYITTEKKFVIQNGFVGNCMMFWALNSSGYTCHLSRVQTYTLEDAQRLCRPDNDEKVWLAKDIMLKATLMTDVQKVGHELYEQYTPAAPMTKKPITNKCTECGRFVTEEQYYCTCPNCGAAP